MRYNVLIVLNVHDLKFVCIETMLKLLPRLTSLNDYENKLNNIPLSYEIAFILHHRHVPRVGYL